MAPSAVNDSARAVMAAAAKYRDDIAGAIATGGTSTAFTVTSYQVFDTLAHLSGQMIAFVPHTTSGGAVGAQVTLNVDGLGAKPIRFAPSVEIPNGTLVQGTPYVVTYNNSDAAFYLQGLGSGNPYNIPLGGMMPFTVTTAPNTSFVFPFGQAISRTTYATYFALVSTTYGVGDGSSTFNIIDMRGRLPIGMDTMPASSAAGRVTTAGSSIDGTTMGATGGAQTLTLVQGNLPNVTLTVTGTIKDSVTNTDTLLGANNTAGSGNAFTASTGGTATSHQLTFNNGATSYLNGAANGSTPATAANKMPPGIIVPYILRVI